MDEADLIKLLPPLTQAEIDESAMEAAFHEAGHLFAMSRLVDCAQSGNIYENERGYVIGLAKADPRWMQHVGKTKFNKETPERTSFNTMEAQGIIYMSGYAAEALFCGTYDEEWTCEGVIEYIDDVTDYEDEQEDLRKAEKMFIESGTMRFIEFEKESRRLRWLAPYRKILRNKRIGVYLLEMAVDLLRNNPKPVQAIADLLLERWKKGHSWIDENEIREIVSRFEHEDEMSS